MKGLELASKVSTKEPYYFGNPDASHKIAALDIGIKKNILRNLANRDCYIKVFPYNAKFEDTLDFNPDAYFVSNGPGDPEPLVDAIAFAKEVLEKDFPFFGICLGHQIMGLALGGETFKLKFGHHGGNHPVKDLRTGRISITSQNHGFCVDPDSLKQKDIEITHMNLNDNTLEGIRHKKLPLFSVQFHPESAPGPHDAEYLFGEFVNMMGKIR